MNNPYGSYTRHNTTTAEHMAALWKEVAREHAARSSSARRYARACHDSMDAAIRRANKAERALASAEQRAEQPRALTADAIESVLHDILPLTTERLEGDDIADIAFDLHAALTEPTDAEVLAALNADYAIRFGPRNFPADSLEPYGDEAVRIMRAALTAARAAQRDEE